MIYNKRYVFFSFTVIKHINKFVNSKIVMFTNVSFWQTLSLLTKMLLILKLLFLRISVRVSFFFCFSSKSQRMLGSKNGFLPLSIFKNDISLISVVGSGTEIRRLRFQYLLWTVRTISIAGVCQTVQRLLSKTIDFVQWPEFRLLDYYFWTLSKIVPCVSIDGSDIGVSIERYRSSIAERVIFKCDFQWACTVPPVHVYTVLRIKYRTTLRRTIRRGALRAIDVLGSGMYREGVWWFAFFSPVFPAQLSPSSRVLNERTDICWTSDPISICGRNPLFGEQNRMENPYL